MKKIVFVSFLSFFLFLSQAPSLFAVEGGIMANVKGFGTVIGRGLINLPSAFLELPRAFRVEKREHGWFWPVGIIPRYFTFGVYRFISGTTDVVFHSLIIPFVEEIPEPWTEPMGLPDYVWQKGEIDY